MNDEKNLSSDKSLNIFTIGDQVLRAKTKAVTSFDNMLKKFVREMLACMYENNGIGIAAPQVGHSRKICVIDVSPCVSEGDLCTMDGEQITDIKTIMPLFLINPIITKKSTDTCTEVEGCLSVPDFSAPVRRPVEVTVEYVDDDGKTHTLTANAILSRCMQHEIDHLNGQLYTDIIGKEDKVKLAKYLSTHGR